MLFSMETLKQLFPEYDGTSESLHVDTVMIDSRQYAKDSLFIPIVGERFNAHDFIEGAIKNGAVATVWDKQYTVPSNLKDECHFFYVDDTIEALHKLAEHYRHDVDPTVIGITGSNGKTTTKDIVASILSTTYKTHKTAGNFNNDIGLPLTILSMPRHTEMLVLEMGMNDFNEIDRLTRLSTPDYGMITNIGESHIEHLGSREGIAKAKLEIINGLKKNGLLIIDGDEPLLQSLSINQSVIGTSFTTSDEVTSKITDVTIHLNTTTFMLENILYSVPLTGAHHAKNASFAIMLAKKLGISERQIKQGLESLEHSDMRFETIHHSSGATIINDAYNASPTSMIGAINVMKSVQGYERKILVLGDVFELGEQAQSFHVKIGEVITKPIDMIFTFGEHAKLISETVQQDHPNVVSKHFSDETSLVEQVKSYMNDHTIVLFKASRGMAFERLIEKIIC